MKTTHLLLSSLLCITHSVVAVPSFQIHGIKPRDGGSHDLNRRLAHHGLSAQLNHRADGPKCDRCDPKKCRKKKYRDKQDCKCKSCLPGMKVDPTKTMCIPEKSDDKPQDKPSPSSTPDNDDKNKKYREKKESEWKKALDRYKESWKKEKEDKDKGKDKDNRTPEEKEKDRKKERIGSCLTLVAASMMSVGAGVKRADNDFKYSNNYFDPSYIDGPDVLNLWPQDVKLKARSLDKRYDFGTDEYVDEALSAIDSPSWTGTSGASPWLPIGPPGRREVIEDPPVTVTNVAVVPHETGVTVYSHEKRFVKAMFQGIARFIGTLTNWLARDGLKRLKALKEAGGFRLADEGKGAKYADQKWAGEQIRKSKNWKNCLQGKKFEKY